MKEISQVTALFVDHEGLYQPLADKLSGSYKRLLYVDCGEQAFPTVNEAVIGESYPDNPRFERVDDFWLQKKDIDLAIFPDSISAGLQLELEAQGIPVWGSRRSIYLEQSRETFLRVLNDLGLDIPPYKRIVGMEALREYLKPRKNQIIKISRYRGTMETKKWRSWEEDEPWLNWLTVKIEGVKNLLPFLVFESIDTPFEIGGDTFNVRGQWPAHCLNGYEWKDKGYFSAWQPRSELPEQLQAVMEAFGPILEKTGHCNFWSMEIRVKDEQFYFIDPTPRAPLPGSGSQIEFYSNLPTVIAAGAEGELVEPEPAEDSKFTAECALCLKSELGAWSSVEVPEDLRPHMKLAGYCTVDGRTWFPGKDKPMDEIGWLVAHGKTPTETIEKIISLSKELPDGVTAATDSLADLLNEIHKAEAEGIPFTRLPVPEPEIVIQSDE